MKTLYMPIILSLISISCADIEKASESLKKTTENIEEASQNVKDAKEIHETETTTLVFIPNEEAIADEEPVEVKQMAELYPQTSAEWKDPATGNLWFLGKEISIAEIGTVKRLCPGRARQATGSELNDAVYAGLLENFQTQDEDYYVWIGLNKLANYVNYDKHYQGGYTMYLGKDEYLLGTIESIDPETAEKAKETYYRTLCMIEAK